ncbi:hypothetical protein [Vibrio phage phiKT1028]|nr:hypothetical protein [Vibrio phage phiKT1028]
MSALLAELNAPSKVSRNDDIVLRGKFDGLAQPHLVKVFFNDEEIDGHVYTDQQGFFQAEFPAKVNKAGNYPIRIVMVENTESGTEVSGETTIRVTR